MRAFVLGAIVGVALYRYLRMLRGVFADECGKLPPLY
jgi:hypothetical protein